MSYKSFKLYLNEAVEHGAANLTAKLTAVADAFYALGTRDATHHANKIYDFIQLHADKSYPEGELESLKDDVLHYAKKWSHIIHKRPVDALGKAVMALKNANPIFNDTSFADDEGHAEALSAAVDDALNPIIDDNELDDYHDALDLDEEAEYDAGTYDYYDINTKTFKTGEGVYDKGKADLKQKTNNPRFGDNSLEDVTINEAEDDRKTYNNLNVWKNDVNKYYRDAEMMTSKTGETRAVVNNSVVGKFSDNAGFMWMPELTEDEDTSKTQYESFDDWKNGVRSVFPKASIVKYKGRSYKAVIYHPQNHTGIPNDEKVGEWEDLYGGWVKQSGLSEDIHMPEKLHLDHLQELLNDAGVSDDEIIAGIGGIQPNAKARVAQALGVPEKHLDFMISELSTKLSKDDEKNYSMFTEDFFAEEYNKILEEDERFGYQQDSMGNVEITDTMTGKSVYLQGTEAQELLQQLSDAPQHEQIILSDYQDIMESVKPKDWKAASKNNIKMAVSKNVKEESKLKTDPEKPKLKPPFEHTKKIVKKKVKSVNESLLDDDDDDFMQEIHSDGGSYNFPWKSKGLQGTGTATFTIKQGMPIIKVVSVRNAQGDEITDYDPADMLVQAKRFIPDA